MVVFLVLDPVAIATKLFAREERVLEGLVPHEGVLL
jgi:hypothetical protein